MYGHRTWIAGIILVAVALAGCTQPGGQDAGYTFTVEEAPSRPVDLGETFTIRWSIEGPEGTTDHTGIHYGLSSAADKEDVSPDDYQATSPHKAGAVPGTFQTTFNITFPGTIYYRTHVIVDGEHFWGPERTIAVEGTPVEMTDVPRTVEAGSNATVTWRIHHITTTQIPHTAVHYGPESKDVDTRGGDPFAYPDLVPRPAISGQIPGTFETTIPAPSPGEIFLRGHAVIDGTNWLSQEHRIRVVNPDAPNIVVLEAPDEVTAGDRFNVTFQANHPNNNTPVDHVGIEWDNESRPANASAYDNATHKGPTDLPLTVPNEFTVEMTAPDVETLFFRAHYRTIGNDTDVLSPEHTIDVTPRRDIAIVDAPADGACVETDDQGEATIDVRFRVTGPDQTSQHIGLHYDNESHAGDDATSGDYANAGPHEGGEVPGTFDRNFTVSETGTYHWRAHAILQDGPLLSQERSVEVQDTCLTY